MAHQYDFIFENQPDHHCTCLYSASLYGHHNCMTTLLNAGNLDVNIKDDDGETPLHMAAMNGSYRCLSLLLDHGAVLNEKSHHGYTALHYAVGYANNEFSRIYQGLGPCNSYECIRVLLDYGIDIEQRNNGGLTEFEMANEPTKQFIDEYINNQIQIKEPNIE
jgi:ankyrin repeat protein